MEVHHYDNSSYRQLPDKPGVYKFLDSFNEIIYIGKAKSLKNRVSSYFVGKSGINRKTQRLVNEIKDIQIVVVDSEADALHLENSLIKENQPKYNILLKDDKSFPSILITNERFPQIYSTRRIDRALGEYFGPYTSVKSMNSVLDLIRKLYKIRTCNYNLSKENVSKGKYKICLEFHLGNCLGPCEGLQTEEEYNVDIELAKEILKGKVSTVRSTYKKKMYEASASFKYELADQYKRKLEYLEKFASKTFIVNPKLDNTDVITIVNEDDQYFVNYMMLSNGMIAASESAMIKANLEEDTQEILQYALSQFQLKFQSPNSHILCNLPFDSSNNQSVIVPNRGDKKQLVAVSERNARLFAKEKRKKSLERTKVNPLLENVKNDLRLETLPLHVECFDNSNIQGSNPVASMVCFRNGKPYKKDYRHFNIKTVTGPNDFASMEEVVYRRYHRLIRDNSSLPDLIVIDGGKGQLSSAVNALKKLDIYGKLPIIGIAKRLEELYYPEEQTPLLLNKKSPALTLIQKLRDEAHRFAITFHRNKRSKQQINSKLSSIPGIGPSTVNKLLKEIGSVKRIKDASYNTIASIIGPNKAKLIIESFKNSSTP